MWRSPRQRQSGGPPNFAWRSSEYREKVVYFRKTNVIVYAAIPYCAIGEGHVYVKMRRGIQTTKKGARK